MTPIVRAQAPTRSGAVATRYWCVGIFFTAFAARLALGIATGAFERRPSGEVARVAQSIAAGLGFSNPNGTPSGPTVHVAPVYPYVLAAVIEAVPARALPAVVATMNIVVASLVWALLPVVASSVGVPAAAGILGGFIGALTPTNHWTELNGYWESTVAGLALMLAVAASAAASIRQNRHTWVAASLGFGWGLTILLQPAGLPVLLVSLVCWLWNTTYRRALTPIATFALVFILTLTPWTIRNYQTMGGFVFVRGNLGVELSVSNNDGALASQENVLQNPLARHPHVDAAEFAQRNTVGELEYNRQRLRDATAWIRANPQRFLELTATRAWLFWIPKRSHPILTLAQWSLATFAAAGMLLMWLHHRFAAILTTAVWATYPLLYYVVQADLRYRYPIEWSIVLAAGFAVLSLCSRMGVLQVPFTVADDTNASL